MNDLTGKTVGSWQILEFAYTAIQKNEKSTHKRNYWHVKCKNCESVRIIEEYNLKPPAGGRCQNCWDLPKGRSGFLDLLGNYKRNAFNNDRDFLLTESQFAFLTSQSCHYCGTLPSIINHNKTKSNWGDYCYNGLDRIDNSLGYTKTNVVTCCLICNRAKNNMSYDCFMSYINKIKLKVS